MSQRPESEAATSGIVTSPVRYGTYSSERSTGKAKTRAKLLRHSCDLFIVRGFDQTPIEDIAAAAGVSRATFYLHFESKQAIVEALRFAVTDRLNVQYNRLARMTRSTVEELTHWIQGFMDACRKDRQIVFVLLRTIPTGAYGFSSFDYYDSVIRRLGNGIERFALASSDENPLIRASALLLLLQLEAVVRHWIMERSAVEGAALRGALANNFFNFINAQQTVI